MARSDELRTRRYRRWRRAYLARHPLCVRCAAHGRTSAAAEIDHVVQRSDGGALMAAANCRPLCRGCHIDRGRGRWSAADEALRGGDAPAPADVDAAAPAEPDADERARRRAAAARDSTETAAEERRRWNNFAAEL